VLLLVTVLLVLAGLVLLIVGFVQDDVLLIWLSIGCAAVAGVALVVFSRLSRRRALRVLTDGGSIARRDTASVDDRTEEVLVGSGARAASTASRPEDPASESGRTPERRGRATGPERPPTSSTPRPSGRAVRPTAADRPIPVAPDDIDEVVAVRRDESVVVAAAAGSWSGSDAASGVEGDGWADDWGDEVIFPIEDYDDLRVGEIVPLLPELDPDELEEVRDRESAGKNRSTIQERIADLLGGQVVASSGAATTAPVPTRAGAGTTRRGPRGGTSATAKAATKKAAAKKAAPVKRAGRPPKKLAAAVPSPAKAKRAGGVLKKVAAASAATTRGPGRPRKATASGSAAAPAKRATAGAKKAAAAPVPAKRAPWGSKKAAAAAAAAAPARRAAAGAKKAAGAPAPAKRAPWGSKKAAAAAASAAPAPAKRAAAGLKRAAVTAPAAKRRAAPAPAKRAAPSAPAVVPAKRFAAGSKKAAAAAPAPAKRAAKAAKKSARR